MNRIRSLLLLTLAVLVLGESPARPAKSAVTPDAPSVAPAMTASGAFFALSVANLDESVKWYTERLGLRLVMRPPKSGQSEVAVLEGGGLIVELVRQNGSMPLSEAAPQARGNLYVQGIFKTGVIVEDYDKTLAMLKERQVEIAFGPFPAGGDQRANVIIKDNADNLIQIFGKAPAPKPAAAH